MVAIFPNVCLWRRSLCSNLENCIEPTSYASTAYVVAIWPWFLFDSFVKILQHLREFFWANGLPPPMAKSFPYAYADFKDQIGTAVIANLALSLLCGTFVQTVKLNELIIH